MACSIGSVGAARNIGLTRCRRDRSGRDRDGFDVCSDGSYLIGSELMFEARHAWRAVANDLAHHVFFAAECGCRQYRPVLAGRDLWILVTKHTGLVEQPRAKSLLLRLANRLCQRCSRNEPNQHQPRVVFHVVPPGVVFLKLTRPPKPPEELQPTESATLPV